MPRHFVEHSAEQLAIFRGGFVHPVLVQNAVPHERPFIHPLLAADGMGELTENEPPHHPWQHGLYTGLNDVNGYGFWTENLTGKPQEGSFHPLPLIAPVVCEQSVAWTVVTEWKATGGELLLTEKQEWIWEEREATFTLDLHWILQAATDLRFGHSSYGGLFLRMPWRASTQGEVLNSEGANSQATAEGQRARWLALSMPLPKREVGRAGVALLDHPSNPQYPNPWRVDDNLGISPSRCIAGEWSLAAHEITTSRYRLVAFNGSSDGSFIEAQWKLFAAS